MISSILKIVVSRQNVTFFFTFSRALPVSAKCAERIGNRLGTSPRTTTINIKLPGMLWDDLGVVGTMPRAGTMFTLGPGNCDPEPPERRYDQLP